MKNLLRLSIILCVLISSHCIQTRIGCLAKSRYLKEPFDTKTYHPVACNCPCDAYHAKGKFDSARNQCLECSHFHDPQPMILVTRIIHTSKTKYPFTTSPHATLQFLINQYRAKKHHGSFDK